jgi:hypothetical protein
VAAAGRCRFHFDAQAIGEQIEMFVRRGAGAQWFWRAADNDSRSISCAACARWNHHSKRRSKAIALLLLGMLPV